MHANAELLEHFYASFARRDAAAMVACYAPDATFRDPIFDLAGSNVGAMWTMLCERGRDLALDWRDVRADDAGGAAHWEPRYTFSVTGRRVHNVIDSRFTFRDGRIATHADTFDLWRWSRMALGTKAVLLGWTPFVQKAIRAEARRSFEGWKARRRP
jgi:ketosteroid isomerase-like protein